MQAKASKIVILCCYLFFIKLIVIKIFRILKIVCWCQYPLVGEECGVTQQSQMLEPPLTRWHDWNEVNKYGGSHPQGQSLLRYQPVCLWYHYIEQEKQCTFGATASAKSPHCLLWWSCPRPAPSATNNLYRGAWWDKWGHLTSDALYLAWDTICTWCRRNALNFSHHRTTPKGMFDMTSLLCRVALHYPNLFIVNRFID